MILLLQCLQQATAYASASSIISRQIQELDPSTLTPEEATLFNFSNPDSPRKDLKCKVFPGDTEWPSDHQWALLNKTTNGALIKTTPIAAPCFAGPLYDADKCAYIASQWTNSSLQ